MVADVRRRLRAAPLRTRLRAAFTVVAVLVAVIAALSAVSFANLIDARQSLLATVDPANVAADRLLVAYLNQETGVRGYVLSGTVSFLEPYQLGQTQGPRFGSFTALFGCAQTAALIRDRLAKE